MVKLINRYCEAAACPEQNEQNTDLQTDSSRIQDSAARQINDREIVLSGKWQMQYYPNPSSDLLNIAFSEQIESLKITDLSGKVLYEMLKPEMAVLLDVRQWSTGIYLIVALNANESITGKLLVMH
jgi:Secretion system C-terminal sorting domain